MRKKREKYFAEFASIENSILIRHDMTIACVHRTDCNLALLRVMYFAGSLHRPFDRTGSKFCIALAPKCSPKHCRVVMPANRRSQHAVLLRRVRDVRTPSRLARQVCLTGSREKKLDRRTDSEGRFAKQSSTSGEQPVRTCTDSKVIDARYILDHVI